ncbi:FkbM family methyltransferase, partial [Burkholderia sp. LMU1-1-1.1]
MSFISYAPNFEDVLLWRALRHVEHGFYIDLAPTAVRLGSSTWALYERGWRGLHLTPAPALARQLRAARPADVTLDGVAGA